MHLHVADAEPEAVEVEDDLSRVLGEQRHRHAAVRDLLRDHERGETLSERIVVVARMPDRDTLGLPGFIRTDGDRRGGHVLHRSAAGGSRILDQRDRMKFDDAGFLLEILFRRRGI